MNTPNTRPRRVWAAVTSTYRRIDALVKPRNRLLVIVAVTILVWGLWVVAHHAR